MFTQLAFQASPACQSCVYRVIETGAEWRDPAFLVSVKSEQRCSETNSHMTLTAVERIYFQGNAPAGEWP
jgi:hypothetical protein